MFADTCAAADFGGDNGATPTPETNPTRAPHTRAPIPPTLGGAPWHEVFTSARAAVSIPPASWVDCSVLPPGFAVIAATVKAWAAAYPTMAAGRRWGVPFVAAGGAAVG